METYLQENRSKGWVSVSEDAPEFAKNYIREYRASKLEQRCFNPVVLENTFRGIEVRSAVARAALRTEARLFPAKAKRPAVAPKNEMDVLRSIAHRQRLELHEDAKTLSRARLDAEQKRAANLLEEQVIAEQRRLFPWSFND